MSDATRKAEIVASRAATAPDVVTDEVLDNFGSLIAVMARLLAGISDIPLFKNAEIGLAEWIALSVLRQTDGINNNQLAKRLGVTRQRAHQIIAGFTKAGFITVRTSTEDSRKNEITLTPAGRAQLNNINAELKTLLAKTLNTRVRMLPRIRKYVALMMQITRVPSTSDAPAAAKPRFNASLLRGQNRAADDVVQWPAKRRG